MVACLSTQAFIDELIAAIDGNRVDWWRARYRRATALLLDDIHLLAGKELGTGSMRPKVEAAAAFVRTGGGAQRAIIAELSQGLAALQGDAGTTITRD